jgi:hypothetical protein
MALNCLVYQGIGNVSMLLTILFFIYTLTTSIEVVFLNLNLSILNSGGSVLCMLQNEFGACSEVFESSTQGNSSSGFFLPGGTFYAARIDTLSNLLCGTFPEERTSPTFVNCQQQLTSVATVSSIVSSTTNFIVYLSNSSCGSPLYSVCNEVYEVKSIGFTRVAYDSGHGAPSIETPACHMAVSSFELGFDYSSSDNNIIWVPSRLRCHELINAGINVANCSFSIDFLINQLFTTALALTGFNLVLTPLTIMPGTETNSPTESYHRGIGSQRELSATY